jgi:hypothetical protein
MQEEVEMVRRLGQGLLASLLFAGCGAAPSAPARPTWADVQPILQGECSGCHGATAATTGSGLRFDFYDMTPATCGDAARAMPSAMILAGNAYQAIKTDVTLVGGRSKMPPLPGAPLAGWERDTLLRWSDSPVLGPPPDGNRPPTIDVGRLPFMIDKQLSFTAIVSDPDGQEVLGSLEIGGVAFLMNRSGSFAVNLDSSQWPAGTQHLKAVLCDGWVSVTYDLGPIQIQH